MRHSPPRRESTPRMRSTFDSIPSIWAPRETRKRQRSCTCGSHAALPIAVSPGVSTAAMTAFSVAMTLASSRKTWLPRRPSRALISKRRPSSTSAPSSAKAWMCGSKRLLPMTSPPGGGTLTAPRRDSSGPARRNDARIRLHSSSSSSRFSTLAARTRIEFRPVHSTSAPTSASSATIVSTSRMRGTFVSRISLSVSRHAARIGSAPFLLPAARIVPDSVAQPSITNASVNAWVAVVVAKGSDSPEQILLRKAAILPRRVEVTRERAWETLTRYTKSEALLRHALAVEASTRFYARKFGEDEELWGVSALLHDFDYEMHPTLDRHPQDGAPILRDEGYPEVVIEGVLSHAEHLAIPRDTPLKKTLFACDELSGFVHACALVRPEGLSTLEPKSVVKKLKQPSFAAGEIG